jgi:hypothetical protein
MMKLQEYWISCASAEQRKGRAGRTGPGIVNDKIDFMFLYSKWFFFFFSVIDFILKENITILMSFLFPNY